MILEVKNGCFSYNSRSILSDISFELEEHKVMTVLGKNHVAQMHYGLSPLEARGNLYCGPTPADL